MNIRADIDPAASDDVVELAERLAQERRRPPAAFRAGLRGALAGRAPRGRPEGLRTLIARFAAAGGLLLALGALGAAGAGPFGL